MAMVLTWLAKIVSSVMPHARPVTEEPVLIELYVLILVSLSVMRVDARFVSLDTIEMLLIKHVRFVTQIVQLEMLFLHVSHAQTLGPTFFYQESAFFRHVQQENLRSLTTAKYDLIFELLVLR